MKSCLICDDHQLLREALSGTIRMGWPAAQVSTVGDFPSAWAEAARGHDLCLADLLMPGAGPLEGIRGILKAAPAMPVLVVTGTEDDQLLLDLLDLGVAGFAPKTSSSEIIEAALRLILAGGRYFPPRLAEIAAARGTPARPAAEPAARHPRLTDRQLEVLRLVADGASNKEVALALALAPSTIKTHLEHLQIHLGAKNRTDLAIRARAQGLI